MTNLSDSTRREIESLRQSRKKLWQEICKIAKLSEKDQSTLEKMLENWHNISKDIEEKNLTLMVAEIIDGWGNEK